MGGDTPRRDFYSVASLGGEGSGFSGCYLSVSPYALQSYSDEERKQKLVPGGTVLHTRCQPSDSGMSPMRCAALLRGIGRYKIEQGIKTGIFWIDYWLASLLRGRGIGSWFISQVASIELLPFRFGHPISTSKHLFALF